MNWLMYSNRTYGKVYKAKNKQSGKLVAIKKFKDSDEEDEHVISEFIFDAWQVRKTVLREIRVLKDF